MLVLEPYNQLTLIELVHVKITYFVELWRDTSCIRGQKKKLDIKLTAGQALILHVWAQTMESPMHMQVLQVPFSNVCPVCKKRKGNCLTAALYIIKAYCCIMLKCGCHYVWSWDTESSIVQNDEDFHPLRIFVIVTISPACVLRNNKRSSFAKIKTFDKYLFLMFDFFRVDVQLTTFDYWEVKQRD